MTQLVVSLSHQEKEQFAMLAAKNDISMSQLIRWFVRLLIRENGRGIDIHIEK